MSAACAYAGFNSSDSWATRNATPARYPGILSAMKRVNDHAKSAMYEQLRNEARTNLINEFVEEHTGEINPESHIPLRDTKRILESLPDTIPLPELNLEPNGSIGLEWYKNKKNVFIVAVQANKTLEYATISGYNNSEYGRKCYVDSIPMPLLANLRRFLHV